MARNNRLDCVSVAGLIVKDVLDSCSAPLLSEVGFVEGVAERSLNLNSCEFARGTNETYS